MDIHQDSPPAVRRGRHPAMGCVVRRVRCRLGGGELMPEDLVVTDVHAHAHVAGADAVLAKEICIAANEGIAELCAAAAGRLTGVGLVPLQHPDLAVAALEHAVLNCGLKGIEISSFARSADGRLDRWYLSNVIGQPLEHTIALSHLMFSGVLDRLSSPGAGSGPRGN